MEAKITLTTISECIKSQIINIISEDCVNIIVQYYKHPIETIALTLVSSSSDNRQPVQKRKLITLKTKHSPTKCIFHYCDCSLLNSLPTKSIQRNEKCPENFNGYHVYIYVAETTNHGDSIVNVYEMKIKVKMKVKVKVAEHSNEKQNENGKENEKEFDSDHQYYYQNQHQHDYEPEHEYVCDFVYTLYTTGSETIKDMQFSPNFKNLYILTKSIIRPEEYESLIEILNLETLDVQLKFGYNIRSFCVSSSLENNLNDRIYCNFVESKLIQKMKKLTIQKSNRPTICELDLVTDEVKTLTKVKSSRQINLMTCNDKFFSSVDTTNTLLTVCDRKNNSKVKINIRYAVPENNMSQLNQLNQIKISPTSVHLSNDNNNSMDNDQEVILYFADCTTGYIYNLENGKFIRSFNLNHLTTQSSKADHNGYSSERINLNFDKNIVICSFPKTHELKILCIDQ